MEGNPLEEEEEPEGLSSLMLRLLTELAATPTAALSLANMAEQQEQPEQTQLQSLQLTTASDTPAIDLLLQPPSPTLAVRAPIHTDLQTALVQLPAAEGAREAAVDLLPRELRSGSLTQCGDRVDFIAPAENMKAFFKLLHTPNSVSLAVHRVGDSLVLEGLEAEPWKLGGESMATAASPATAQDVTAGSPGAAAGALQLHRKALQSRFICYSMGSSSAADAQPTAGGASDPELQLDEEEEEDDDEERESWMPPRDPPRGFRRVVRWQLNELSLLLGSDTVVFKSEQGRGSLDGHNSADGFHSPGFSVALHDANSAATSMVCLDYWLDNVMSHASDVALCMHTDGVVQGYRVVPTSELPIGGGGLGSGFSPAAVSECAVSVLRFLRDNCTREAGTYWLVRPHGGDELRLFDITDQPEAAAAARSTARRPLGRRREARLVAAPRAGSPRARRAGRRPLHWQ